MLGLLCFASSCGFYVFWSLRVRRSLVLIIVPLSKHINTIFCWPTRIHFWSIIIYLLYGVTDNRKSCFGSEVLECKWEDQLWAKQKWVDFQLLETFLKSSHLPVFAGRIKTQRIGLLKVEIGSHPWMFTAIIWWTWYIIQNVYLMCDINYMIIEILMYCVNWR